MSTSLLKNGQTHDGIKLIETDAAEPEIVLFYSSPSLSKLPTYIGGDICRSTLQHLETHLHVNVLSVKCPGPGVHRLPTTERRVQGEISLVYLCVLK